MNLCAFASLRQSISLTINHSQLIIIHYICPNIPMKKKRAIVLVTNDLSNDRRVDNTCTVLTDLGFAVTLVGRHRKSSRPLAKRAYNTYRMRLWFCKGFLFYAEINMRLFFFLMARKCNLIVANDLDTLLPAYEISRLKACALVYDSHEFFTGVPGLFLSAFIRARMSSPISSRLSQVACMRL